MSTAILVLNAGSSSLKFALFDAAGLATLARGQVEGIGTEPHFRVQDSAGDTLADARWAPLEAGAGHRRALARILAWLDDDFGAPSLVGVGHRVVHGGERFARPTPVDTEVLTFLETLVPLAPLHQPHNLAPVHALLAERPGLPQVACFDTAFHRSHPAVADCYALPPRFHDAGVRRYGFHGLSYEYVSARLAELDPASAAGRVIVAHLGNGASLCAIGNGASVDSTLGFSTLDGLPMGTRCGSIDPGVLLHLMRDQGFTADALERLLTRESGLLGLSGLSNDMRVLLESETPAARFAVDYFVYRVVGEIGRLAAVLGGLDALVFTAGIGEHAAPVRERVCAQSAWLGVALDAGRNATVSGAARVSSAQSDVAVWVVPTNEERMIARHVLDLLAPPAGQAVNQGA
ncbi:MAG: acetate/propionate family kinase [Gammaproteobacteria bacterium]